MPLPTRSQWTATAQRRDAPLSNFNPVHSKASVIIWILARHLEAITHTRGCWPGRGWDPGSSEHGTGRALDWMISDRVAKAVTLAQRIVGDLVVAWLIKHADQLRIRHIIWHGRIWKRRYRHTATAWTKHYGNSVSARHEDHIHIYLDNEGGSVPDAPLLAVASPGLPSTGDLPTHTAPKEIPLSAAEVEEIKSYIREQRRVLQEEGIDREGDGMRVLMEEVRANTINAKVTSGGEKTIALAVAQSRNFDEAQSVALAELAAMTRERAARDGLDVDAVSAAFVATVVDQAGPQLKESLREILDTLPVPIDAESIADEVAATLGEKLLGKGVE